MGDDAVVAPPPPPGETVSTSSPTSSSSAAGVDDDGDKEEEEILRSRKRRIAKARWKILRSAILGSARDRGADDDGEDEDEDEDERAMREASIHRFPGYGMLSRRIISPSSSSASSSSRDVVEYSIDLPSGGGPPLRVRTLEAATLAGGEKKKFDLKDLTSERRHGVDNTSNARVWDAESALAHCLLRGRPPKTPPSPGDENGGSRRRRLRLPFGPDALRSLASTVSSSRNGNNDPSGKVVRVIELGAGMAGLAGLALGAVGLAGRMKDEDDGGDVTFEVCLTDGHPDAVENNRRCAELTSKLYSSSSSSDNPNNSDSVPGEEQQRPPLLCAYLCARLLWTTDPSGVADCRSLTSDGLEKFRLCLASDCVHFTEFHGALLATIGRLLEVGGVCLMCQPRRGTSLDRFVALIEGMNDERGGDESDVGEGTDDGDRRRPLFDVELHEEYDEEVARRHRRFLEDKRYDPNVHRPLVLSLTKLREYEEGFDTERIVRLMKERDDGRWATTTSGVSKRVLP